MNDDLTFKSRKTEIDILRNQVHNMYEKAIEEKDRLFLIKYFNKINSKMMKTARSGKKNFSIMYRNKYHTENTLRILNQLYSDLLNASYMEYEDSSTDFGLIFNRLYFRILDRKLVNE